MRRASWILVTSLGLPGAAIVLGGAAWPFELAYHFVGHLAVAASVAALAGLALRRYPPALAAAALAVAYGVNVAAPPGGLISSQARAAYAAGAERLDLVSFNVLGDQKDPRAMLAWLAGRPADVLVLLESSARWRAGFRALRAAYPHQIVAVPRPGARRSSDSHEEDTAGVAVLSRIRFLTSRVIYPAGPRMPAIVVELARPGSAPLTLVAAHPTTPLTPTGLAVRDRYLDGLAAALSGTRGPLVVAGDLNATRYTPVFGRLTAALGLHTPRNPPATYPAFLGRFGLAIDHVLTRGARLESLKPVAPHGSDHRGLFARLAVPAG